MVACVGLRVTCCARENVMAGVVVGREEGREGELGLG